MHRDGISAVPENPQSFSTVHSFEQGHPRAISNSLYLQLRDVIDGCVQGAVSLLDLDGGGYRLITIAHRTGEWVDMVGDYDEYPDETITPLSSADLDEAVMQFLNRPRRAEVLKITLPSGRVVVVMPEEHFEAYIATSELLSNPARAAAIKRNLDESRG
jgi:hypothetical protein